MHHPSATVLWRFRVSMPLLGILFCLLKCILGALGTSFLMAHFCCHSPFITTLDPRTFLKFILSLRLPTRRYGQLGRLSSIFSNIISNMLSWYLFSITIRTAYWHRVRCIKDPNPSEGPSLVNQAPHPV